MSTGLECSLIEPEPGRWHYVLQSEFDSRNAWDWRDNASAYGPFATYDQACEHLADHHANPGGHSFEPNNEFRTDETWQRLIAAAPDNMASRNIVWTGCLCMDLTVRLTPRTKREQTHCSIKIPPNWRSPRMEP